MRADTDLEYELHAYVDGDLDEAAMVRIEAHLRRNPDAAGKVRAYLRQKDQLRRAARQQPSVEESPALAELSRALARRLAPRSRLGWRRTTVIAGLFLLGWVSHALYAPLAQLPAFASEVVQAHLLISSDTSEVRALSPERLSRLFARIGETERLPDLREFGFEPVGAELVPGAEGIVLHIPYRSATGVLVSYFLLHDDEDLELPRHVSHQQGVTTVYWQHDHSRYALAAPLADEEISRIARFLDSAQGELN